MKGKNGGYGSRVRMRQTTAERQGAPGARSHNSGIQSIGNSDAVMAPRGCAGTLHLQSQGIQRPVCAIQSLAPEEGFVYSVNEHPRPCIPIFDTRRLSLR